MDLQAINTDYGIIPSEQEFNFETSFDFSSIMLIGSTSNAKRCLNDDGTICQVGIGIFRSTIWSVIKYISYVTYDIYRPNHMS